MGTNRVSWVTILSRPRTASRSAGGFSGALTVRPVEPSDSRPAHAPEFSDIVTLAPWFIPIGVQRATMTTDSVSDRVRELAEHHDMEESGVIQQAVETGVETLYRDMLVSRYLADEITHDEAIDELGVEVVEHVEAAREAIEEDVEWGLRV